MKTVIHIIQKSNNLKEADNRQNKRALSKKIRVIKEYSKHSCKFKINWKDLRKELTQKKFKLT